MLCGVYAEEMSASTYLPTQQQHGSRQDFPVNTRKKQQDFLRKKKYIRFIDPLSFEEEKNNDIIYEHEGIIFLSFLRFIFSQDITENVIQLRDDPAKTAFINSNLDMPRIEAVYEQKDLTKALNSTNFIDLKMS